MITPTVYKLKDREIHMVGENVGICWNCKTIKKEFYEDGLIYKAETLVRQGSPYIDFVCISEYDGIFYEDKNESAMRGMSKETARIIIDELINACEYIEQIRGKN